MIYYPTKASCPNGKALASMTKEQAVWWAMRSPSHCTEVSRLAEIRTYFGLSSDEVKALHDAALKSN